VNAFGSSATAAYGAVNQMVGYVLAPVQGVSVAATVFARRRSAQDKPAASAP